MKITVGLVRLALAALILVAVVAQLARSLQAPGFFFFNFFGYFTIQSNLIVMVTFVLGGVWLLRGAPQPDWLVIARGAAATYIGTTGIVYNTLLTNIPANDFTVRWSNDIVHKWIPLLAVIEWIVVGDRFRIPWRRLWFFLIYPLVWVIATLARGSSFVPYPFLNVAKLGWGTVLLYCLLVTVIIAGLSAVVIWLSRFRPIAIDDATAKTAGTQARASVSST